MAFNLAGVINVEKVKASVVKELYAKTFFAQTTTGEFKTDLTKGEKVKVGALGDVTIGDYTGVDIALQDGADTSEEVLINQDKYFNIFVDGADQWQSNVDGLITKFGEKGGRKLGVTMDAFGYAQTAAGAGITLETVADLTEANVIQWLGDISTQLQDANVDLSLVTGAIPPFAMTAIASAYGITTSSANFQSLATGVVMDSFGISLISTTNLDKTGAKTAVKSCFYDKDAILWALAIQEMEFYKPEKRFGQAVKARVLYGADVVLPAAVGVSLVTQV